MVKLIVGNKGSGKTKTLINLVNSAAENSKGNVVCIEKGDALKFDLKHNIRLIDIEEYRISGPHAYYGFIAGLLAGNYDITELFADAMFKILFGKGEKDFELFEGFVERIAKLVESNNGPDITFTVSCDESEVPESIKKYIHN